MATYEIPLSATPQSLSVTLAGVQYRLTLKWCDPASVWVLDIADASGNAMVCGIPLVTGADLLAQYAYLGFGGQLIALTDNDPSAPPTYAGLGATGHLRFVTA